MKSSRYNICLPYEDNYIIFNGITKRFFQVSSHNKETFLQILSAPDDYIGKYDPFLKRMSDEGFIIEDCVDELKIIKQQFNSMNDSVIYHLMILPTYACNVSCWYCTQKHRNIHLNDEDFERIKKHIAYYLTEHNLQGLHLSWFGGEPLLDFQRIEEISVFAQQFCIEHGLIFYNTITTNGILLSKKYLEKMKELNFTFFQITIDGIQEEHDKVKVVKSKSAYETTLRNICLIVENIPSAEICLRYNFSMRNLKPDEFISNLNQFLPKEVRRHVRLAIMKLWQEEERDVDESLIDCLVNNAWKEGYSVSVGPGFQVCYVDNKHFNCIFSNGKVDKCDNEDFENCRGRINTNGQIVWSELPLFFSHTVVSHQNECTNCKYLPLCYGPCPVERDRACKNNSPLKCRFSDKYKVWKYRIYNYCRIHIRNNQLLVQ